jgi:Fe-S cluster assembly protein SufD
MTGLLHAREPRLHGAERPLAESSLEELLGRPLPAGEPSFVRALREAGRDTFQRVGMPTTRQEDWRFTSLAALSPLRLETAPRARVAVSGLPPPPRLVFVNGRLDSSSSDLTGLPAGLRMGSLAAALRERPAALEALLGRIAPARDHAFCALNAGLFEDGALIELEDGADCGSTLGVVFVSSAAVPAAVQPRSLLVAGKGARATLVERYRGDGTYLVNAVTEVALGEGAQVEHVRLQREAPDAFHHGLVLLSQREGSRFAGRSIALGGQLSRVEVRAILGGERASCDLQGLSVAGGDQVVDHLVHIDHKSPRCTSRQLFKAILDGSSRGVFAGRVLVREGAIKSDAGQVSSSLLLSDDATADARPELEIRNDDVKCSHGGSVGQLREDQIFYLRARGLGEGQARALLTWAFASEVVEAVGPAATRARVRRAVTALLPHGELLGEVA